MLCKMPDRLLLPQGGFFEDFENLKTTVLVADTVFSFINTGNDTAYWAAFSAGLRTLLALDTIDGFATV